MSRVDLYTTLVQVKRGLNGGRMPPMTPIPHSLREVIDPDFTIGLGALAEDEVRGLRCPVRGCGKYFLSLTKHLNVAHPDVGGALGVKRMLSMPSSVGLVAQSTREKLAAGAANRPRFACATNAEKATCASLRMTPERRAQRSRRTSEGARCVSRLNFRDRCAAQVGHKLIDLHNKLGREPTERDGKREYGYSFVVAVRKLFGTWLSALAQQGLEVHRHSRAFTRDEVTAAYVAFFEVHGYLPSKAQVNSNTLLPITPDAKRTVRALGVSGYEEALQSLAFSCGAPYARVGSKTGWIVPPKSEQHLSMLLHVQENGGWAAVTKRDNRMERERERREQNCTSVSQTATP